MMIRKIRYSSYNELIFYFLIYSFIGWCLETTVVSIQSGYFVKRGFIFGPFCIIYGFGMLLLIILLSHLSSKILIYFISSAMIITLLEYTTGLILEITFNRRWWDYSHLPFNLQGYISLKNSIIWGILATLISKKFHPRLETLIRKVSSNKISPITLSISIFFIINILISIAYHF